INTAIASRTGGNNGVGFAIPSNLASSIMDAIVKHGRVQRGRLGALIQDLNEDLAKSFNFDSTKGVLIGDVLDDSPAKKAGLKSGDIVVEFNGKPMDNANQLRMAVAAIGPGTSSELTIVRDGKRQTVKITTDELTDETAKAGPSGAEESSADFGLTVQTLTPELAERLGYEQNQQGVVITDVNGTSIAARAGLRQGDLGRAQTYRIQFWPMESPTPWSDVARPKLNSVRLSPVRVELLPAVPVMATVARARRPRTEAHDHERRQRCSIPGTCFPTCDRTAGRADLCRRPAAAAQAERRRASPGRGPPSPARAAGRTALADRVVGRSQRPRARRTRLPAVAIAVGVVAGRSRGFRRPGG
ncbi:MAG: PDZ domain-containing protein, partial [Pirellulaceae bacterium]|nr:PDZ domain-containing protein [Pirellulaceae bacterium]